jgi:hypothetical protein
VTERTCAVEGCERKAKSRGWCQPHYTRWYRYGDPTHESTYVRHGASADERLRHVGWTEVAHRPELGPCWEWKGAKHGNGYGKVGNGKQTATTHRLAYTAWVASIPEGMAVLHRCDNRACINPDHLFLGTIADNHADMRAKGRQNDPVKITDEQVAAIRAAYTGQYGQQAKIAREYGVSQAFVSLVVRGQHRRNRDRDNVGVRSATVRAEAAEPLPN